MLPGALALGNNPDDYPGAIMGFPMAGAVLVLIILVVLGLLNRLDVVCVYGPAPKSVVVDAPGFDTPPRGLFGDYLLLPRLNAPPTVDPPNMFPPPGLGYESAGA